MASPIRSLCTAGVALTMLVLVSPAAWASQATALKCKDGTTSASTGRGACSGHGGVDKTASKAASKTVKTQEKVAKTVAKTTPGAQVTQMCADGTTSNSTGRGACSGHGGVSGAAATSKTTGVPIAAAATATPPKPGKVYNKPITTPAPHDDIGRRIRSTRGQQPGRRNRSVQRRDVLSLQESHRYLLEARWRCEVDVRQEKKQHRTAS